jgi:hypothetical protein
MPSFSNIANRTGSLLGAIALLGALTASSARAEDFERTVPVEPGGTLLIELSSGSIDVETHDLSEVEIDARTSGWARRAIDFELEHDGDELHLIGSRSSWLPALGPGRIKVRARIPELFSVDLHTSGGHIDVQEVTGQVEARTSGGNIELNQITGEIEVQTSGGSVKAGEISGNLAAKTSGGSIHISEVNGDVEVETSGGSIRIRDVDGVVEAETSGGAISVRFTGAPAGELETSGGSIEVQFPPGKGVDLEAQTSGGRVSIDEEFAISGRAGRSEVEAKLNGGGPELSLETSGGNIRVRAR